MDETQIISAKKYNEKIYPFYKMVSWDLLFYYSIIFLFLNRVKGLSASEILLCDSFYPLFKVIFQIPFVTIVDKFGKRNSIILGNSLLTISMFILLFFPGIVAGILLNIFMAAGFTLKGLCETSLLDECITNLQNKRTIFSKLDGRGNSLWYLLDAISAVVTGFSFVINPYYPIIICIFFCILSTCISFKFRKYEIIDTTRTKEFSKIIKHFKQIRSSFKFIFKSNRLRNLIIFAGIFHGLLGIRSTLTSSLLTDIGVPEQYFGIISAILGIFASVSAKSQHLFHNAFKNKTLTFLAIPYCTSIIISGLIVITNINIDICFIIVLIMFAIQNIIKGPYYTLIYRYLNSFSTPEMSTRIYSADAIVEGIFRFLITIYASILLSNVATSYTLILIGSIFLIILLQLLDYMKKRVGLKPEEYPKSDIEYTFVKY